MVISIYFNGPLALGQKTPGAEEQQEQVPPHRPIVEAVNVTHVAVAVRVFHDGNPVPGLQKEDFKLLVNGKETAIASFFENRKTIKPAMLTNSATTATRPARLFVLIFNIANYPDDLSGVLDTLFSGTLNVGDRLMVFTNNFLFEDRVIQNLEQEKAKLTKVLQMETEKTGKQIKLLEQRLANLVRTFISRLNSFSDMAPAALDSLRNDFILDYAALLNEFHSLYLNLNTATYAQLAVYLKEQKLEKWVLSFYQVGQFYKPKFNSSFLLSLIGGDFMTRERLYARLNDTLEPTRQLPQEDLGKLFTNSGATFHTLALNDSQFVQNELAEDLSLVPIFSEAYDLLEEIAKKTGGTFVNARDALGFFEKITAKEDIVYSMTYIWQNNNEKIEVLLNKNAGTKNLKDYRIVFDDQRRGSYLRKVMRTEQERIPHIRIEQVDFSGNLLSIIVSGFQLKLEKPAVNPRITAETAKTDKKEEPEAGILKLPMRLQVFNRDSRSLYDGVQMFPIDRQALKKARVRLQVAFPVLTAGVYDLYIWIGDPLTGKWDLAVKEVIIPTTTKK